MASKKQPTTEVEAQVSIKRIAAETLQVPIIGTAPLIVHAWSAKARRQMLDAMQGRKSPKEPKNPEGEYEDAFYRLKDGRPGMPALSFKAASVGAARYFGKDVSMANLRQFMFFRGEPAESGMQLVAIDGEAVMREDVVKVGVSGRDLRYRPEFPEWKALLVVTYVTASLTRDSVLSLIDAGGMGVGVGEWRPEKRGDYGTYQIDESQDIEVLT